ncbi:type II toxin-antitoxin system RelE/ParE family toxin [Syntrophomonas palmitatica]|uniref:type II toxin-antitoxin system RelE/ParE family toxin n=1 Tax=Syntrophomonas palmitatica TaxID=402877 RepID=UPI0024203B02|nr:type II toxin-antitoxin system RelE/ParE family toxin [Syntrophomonas palmitatica]
MSAQLSAPVTALKLMDLVNEAISGLAVMPQKCPPVSHERLAMMRYRKMIVKNYIVFYDRLKSSKTVDVERILYARRDWHHIL